MIPPFMSFKSTHWPHFCRTCLLLLLRRFTSLSINNAEKKLSIDVVHDFFNHAHFWPIKYKNRQVYQHIVRISCLLTRLKGCHVLETPCIVWSKINKTKMISRLLLFFPLFCERIEGAFNKQWDGDIIGRAIQNNVRTVTNLSTPSSWLRESFSLPYARA